jgi:hypothetical protein
MLAAGSIAVPACDSPTRPPADPASFAVAGNRVVASATGGGHYLLGGALDIKFSFSAVSRANGGASGQFRQSVAFDDDVVEFHGAVTCLTTDPVNGRAWIGGVITANTSTAPDFIGPIFEVGRDVWFRVLDGGEGAGAVDRSTFLGFEGGGGIITSAEYCAAQIWPAGDARTHPVTSGDIQVRP